MEYTGFESQLLNALPNNTFEENDKLGHIEENTLSSYFEIGLEILPGINLIMLSIWNTKLETIFVKREK